MRIVDLFSKRQKASRGELPDVYTYTELPLKLRTQIVHIWMDIFPLDAYSEEATKVWTQAVTTLRSEYGVFELVENQGFNLPPSNELIQFFLAEQDVERALDVVELMYGLLCGHLEHSIYRHHFQPSHTVASLTETLNGRFRENGIGYQVESGRVVRVDDEIVHQEAVRPALVALRASGFEGANEEFLNAHTHYRAGKTKEALVDANKAFESTMKAICKLRGWTYEPSITANGLIRLLLDKQLLRPFSEEQLKSVQQVLASGVPTLRNKLGAHGQGAEPLDVPAWFSKYALNLTATTILFLVDAHNHK